MKHGKKLTREMKFFLEQNGFYPNEWLYIKNTKETLVIHHVDDINDIRILSKINVYF